MYYVWLCSFCFLLFLSLACSCIVVLLWTCCVWNKLHVCMYVLQRCKTYIQSFKTLQHGWFFGSWRSELITDALASLHWIRFPERILFKVAVNGSAPVYLSSYFTRVADVPSRLRLPLLTNWWCHLTSSMLSTSGPFQSPAPISGTVSLLHISPHFSDSIQRFFYSGAHRLT